jgi:hypothetical protein
MSLLHWRGNLLAEENEEVLTATSSEGETNLMICKTTEESKELWNFIEKDKKKL